MFFQFFSYLKFLFSSTNQHGVHSPFVYNFVTKGLYVKNVKNNNFNTYSQLKNLSKKEQSLLSKIVKHFNIDTIHFDYKKTNSALNKNFNLLYLNILDKEIIINLNCFTSKNIILFKGIYQNKNAQESWQKIIIKKEVKVSIDLFYFGLIFFRKEQAKEHFKIRV